MTLHAGAGVAVPEPLWATDRWRWALLAAAAVMLAVFPFVATHPKSLADLTEAVEVGAVSRVWVADALPSGAAGYATAEVRWKQGGITHATHVIQLSESTATWQGPGEVVVGDVRQYLRSLPAAEGTSLEIVDASRSDGPSVLGWPVPVWVAAASLVLWVLTVSLVAGGPTPWRATRWAWFWFVASPVAFIGVPAFLALGGRLPWGRTDAPSRRLTGGRALIAVYLLSAFTLPLQGG